MKNAFIRTKKQAEAQQNESNATPEAYAEEHVEHAVQRGISQLAKAPKRIKTRTNAESFTEAARSHTQETRNDVPWQTAQECNAPLQHSPRDARHPSDSLAKGLRPLDSCQYNGLRAAAPERPAGLPSGNAGAELRKQRANICRQSAGSEVNKKSEILNVKTLSTGEINSQISVEIDPQIVTERGRELAKTQAKQRYIKTKNRNNSAQSKTLETPTKALEQPTDIIIDSQPEVALPALDAGSPPRRSSAEPLFVPQDSYAALKPHAQNVSTHTTPRTAPIFRRLTPDAKIKNFAASSGVSKGLRPLAGDFKRGRGVPFCASVPSGRSPLVKAPKASVAPVGIPVVQPPVKRSRLAVKSAAKSTANAVKRIAAASKTLTSALVAGGSAAAILVVVICLIGMLTGSCFGIFFSGEDSGTGQTMPVVVREINREFEDKIAEIKANNPHDVLRMSGTRAAWTDVLAVYAVKTTTDSDNPQDVATIDDGKKARLKEIFWKMNEIEHRVEAVTRTVTVTEKDEDGNDVQKQVPVTTRYLYINIIRKSANAMANEYNFDADQREQLGELLAPENRSLWNAVLYGIGIGAAAADDIVAVAVSQIGNVGGEPYWSWYGFPYRVEWCACFVSWCAEQCGYIDAGLVPKFAGCVQGAAWFQSRGAWLSSSAEPAPGMIVFFDWAEGGQDSEPDHVGIVEKVENSIVYTIEGNSRDMCRERQYPVGYYEIYGYGVIAG